MTSEEQATLEMFIDRHGVYATLDAVSAICGLKAEHIRQNWQDHDLAGEWEKAEVAIDKAANTILDLNLDGKA